MVNIMDLYFTTFIKYAEKYGKDKLLHACQVGSFMEFYATDTEGPDLQKLSDILNMVVSKKDKSISMVDRNNPYMMGYPIISHSKFLKIMLDNGYIVVVTEQVTPPPFPKRKVTGVYTSSNCIDDNNHDNNFLMAMYIENVNKNNRLILSETGHPHGIGPWPFDKPRITLAYDVSPLMYMNGDELQHWVPLA